MSKLDLNTKFLFGIFYSSTLQKSLSSNPEKIRKFEYLWEGGENTLKEAVTQEPQEELILN